MNNATGPYHCKKVETITEIEFTKWLVSYASGFKWKEKGWIETPEKCGYNFGKTVQEGWWIDPINWKLVYYPLLLQQAIEGINRKYIADRSGGVFEINQDFHCLSVVSGCDLKFFTKILKQINIGEAKEQVLKYIWEQER